MADRLGRRIGDYRLVRFLGRGSYGEVYLGEHVRDRSQVAVKLLSSQMNETELKQFIKEASTAARMKHPHIVQLLGFGLHHDDTPYLITTYAPHGSLRQRHPSGSRVDRETIVLYVKQIAEALQYLHSDRRIHRDIKPDNILVGPGQQLLLSDFGITIETAATGYISLQQDAGGTIAYAAPEQIRQQAHPASDQYALAIMVYEWLCGSRPFEGSYLQIMYQQLEVPPPSLRERESTIAEEIEQVVMKALAKQPEQRYESVEAFARQFEQAVFRATQKQQDSVMVLMELLRRAREEPSLDIQIPGVEIERRLEGSHYLARRIATGELLALELFPREDRFHQENALLRSLHHPHIIRWTDAGQSGSMFYLLTEYCDAGSLAYLTKQLSPHLLPFRQAVMLLSQAIAGLAYLHSRNIVHRNLNPYTILVQGKNQQQQAKIAGMSLAKPFQSTHWLEELYESGDDFSTPFVLSYTAREVVVDAPREYHFVSDVWSMGAICYFVFTGRLPKEHKPRQDPLEIVLLNAPIPIRQRNPHFPQPLAQVIDRALAENPADRYQNGQQFYTAFAQALQQVGK